MTTEDVWEKYRENYTTKTRDVRSVFDNATINGSWSFFPNTTQVWTNEHSITYIIVPLLCVFFCAIATIINARILFCVKWIRRPLSPTLYISLSLALADTCSAVLIGLGFIFNSLLPKGLNVNVDNDCLFLILEAFRLSGILISTIHLLVLAGNHYFGILFPFRSIRWMTHTNLTIIVVFIWITPTAYIFAYFGSFKNQGFQREDCLIEESNHFLSFSRFRTIFSALFFIPLILMFAIYIHISIIVRKHQASRRWYNRHSRRQDTGSRSDQQKQFDKNLKAIWTSLLILSTYVICFMPAVLHFYLICNDCYFEFESVSTKTLILTSSITNFLLITKYLLNPLIYASRMHEIRVATRQMNAECRRKICHFTSIDDFERGGGSLTDGTQRFSIFSGSSRRNHVGLNSIHVRNGFPKMAKKIETTDL